MLCSSATLTQMFPVRRHWPALLIISAVLFAVILQIPQWKAMMEARFGGVLVKLNSDEELYLARVEEALNGRVSQADEAFIGDPAIRGPQAAVLEEAVGVAFGWTGY